MRKTVKSRVLIVAFQFGSMLCRPNRSNRSFWSFFSHYMSASQRQPNGNTLICKAANARFLEVKPDGEIV
jgi:hypothetical protein